MFTARVMCDASCACFVLCGQSHSRRCLTLLEDVASRGLSVWALVGALAPQPRLVLGPRCHNLYTVVFAQRVLGSGGIVVQLILGKNLNNFITGPNQIKTCFCMGATKQGVPQVRSSTSMAAFLASVCTSSFVLFWLSASPCLPCAIVLHRGHHFARWAV